MNDNTLIHTVVQDTTKALVIIASEKHFELDNNKVGEAVKTVLKKGFEEHQNNLRDALGMGEPLLQKIHAAGCVKFAIDALKLMGHNF